MSSSNYSHNANVISDDFVKKTCPKEYAALNKILIDNKSSFADIASIFTDEGDIFGELRLDYEENIAQAILNAYALLIMTFNHATDLGLSLRHHAKEGLADEVDGMFWEVEGVYVYSSAGEKYKDHIENKRWTTFG